MSLRVGETKDDVGRVSADHPAMTKESLLIVSRTPSADGLRYRGMAKYEGLFKKVDDGPPSAVGDAPERGEPPRVLWIAMTVSTFEIGGFMVEWIAGNSQRD